MLQNRPWPRRVDVNQVIAYRAWVQSTIDMWVLEDRFNFTSKDHPARILAIIQRLHTELVARQKQLLTDVIPQSKGKDAV